MKGAVLFVSVSLLFAGKAGTASVSAEYLRALPEDAEKTAFVTEVLAMTGLHNDVRVVRDPETTWCGYATTVRGQQYIAFNPNCISRLRSASGYDWRSVGVLAHEIGHLLGGHTTNATSGHREESEADEWAGWAMRRLGASLAEAQTFARKMSVEGSATHPPRQVRMASVERGWRNAGDKTASVPGARATAGWWTRLMDAPVQWPWELPAEGH